MQCVSAIDPVWLAEAAPLHFTVKDGSTSAFAKRRQEKEDMARMEAELAERRAEEEAVAEEARPARQPSKGGGIIAMAGQAPRRAGSHRFGL